MDKIYEEDNKSMDVLIALSQKGNAKSYHFSHFLISECLFALFSITKCIKHIIMKFAMEGQLTNF